MVSERSMPLSMSERTEGDAGIRRHGQGFGVAGSAPWAVAADQGIGKRRSVLPAPPVLVVAKAPLAGGANIVEMGTAAQERGDLERRSGFPPAVSGRDPARRRGHRAARQ